MRAVYGQCSPQRGYGARQVTARADAVAELGRITEALRGHEEIGLIGRGTYRGCGVPEAGGARSRQTGSRKASHRQLAPAPRGGSPAAARASLTSLASYFSIWAGTMNGDESVFNRT
jgi:hypothetical protein